MSLTISAKPQFRSSCLNRITFFAILLLTLLWVILRENITVPEAVTGAIAGCACLFFCRKYLPFSKIENIRPLRLALYPFYLIGQVYLAGIGAIKIILTNADAEIIEVKTQVKNPFLRTILANSITLIPGSVSLELKDDAITVLWLKSKSNDSTHALNAGESIKNKLERKLLKIER